MKLVLEEFKNALNKMIEELNKHSVKYSFKRNGRINCVMYSFALYKHKEVWETIECGEIYPDTEFIVFCILKGYLIEKEKEYICDSGSVKYVV